MNRNIKYKQVCRLVFNCNDDLLRSSTSSQYSCTNTAITNSKRIRFSLNNSLSDVILSQNALCVRWCNEVLKSVRAFRPSQIYAGNSYLENHLNSSLNEYFKQKKTLENSYLGSSRLIRSYIRPNRGTGPTCTFNF